MKLYFVCDCCREIYHDYEIEGPEGTAQFEGLCQDCQSELGTDAGNALSSMKPSYH